MQIRSHFGFVFAKIINDNVIKRGRQLEEEGETKRERETERGSERE